MPTKISEINLKGLSTSPLDYENSDGQLAIALGVAHEDDSLKSLIHTAPKLLRKMSSTQSILYRHKNESFVHYIWKDTNGSYKWFSENSNTLAPTTSQPSQAPASRTFLAEGGSETDEVVEDEPEGEYETFVSNILDSLSVKVNNNSVTSDFIQLESADSYSIYAKANINGNYNPNVVTISGVDFTLVKNNVNADYKSLSVSAPGSCEYTFTNMALTSNDLISAKCNLYWSANGENKTESATKTFVFSIGTSGGTGGGDTGETGGVDLDGKTEETKVKIKGSFDRVPANSVNKVIAIGNTIIFFCDNDRYYYKWKNQDGEVSYYFIGSQLPEIRIKFGLKAHKYRTCDNTATFDKTKTSIADIMTQYVKLPTAYLSEEIASRKVDASEESTEGNVGYIFNDADIASVTNATLGAAAKFTGKWCSEKGYFSQPFLVRAAYRLFDESTSMDTAPVLMIPCTTCNPIANIMLAFRYGMTIDISGVACSLVYFIDDTFKQEMKNWEDVIKKLEIFTSQQFFTYDQDGKCEKFSMPLQKNGGGVVAKDCLAMLLADNINVANYENENAYKKRSIYSFFNSRNIDVSNLSQSDIDCSNDYITIKGKTAGVFTKYMGSVELYLSTIENNVASGNTAFQYCPPANIPLPEISQAEIQNNIKNCGTYYLIKEYSNDELTTGGAEIDLKNFDMTTIVNRETLSPEYESHHKIVPKVVTTYNDRLNIANVKKYFFNGFPITEMNIKCDGGGTSITPKVYSTYTFTHIRNNKYDAVKKVVDTSAIDSDYPFNFLYYPDPDAYKISIVQNTSSGYRYCEFALEEHKGLNGALYFRGLYNPNLEWVTGASAVTRLNELIALSNDNESPQVLANVVYTSEVTNPFVFKAKNVEQVGGGEIITMKPAAVALSQGQFGSYPMYCFTTDGIWALSVNDTGGWKARQPISRDVPLNEKVVLQMDREIIFATARGLMVMVGSKIDCISEIFDGAPDKSATQLPNIDDVFELTDIQTDDEELTDYCKPFKKYLETCNMLYDYTHQRIILGNENYKFSYVYSSKDKYWTTTIQQVLSPINSYPDCLAMTRDRDGYNLLVDFADSGDNDAEDVTMPNDGFIVTRPISLDSSDMFKTIRAVVARGTLNRTHVDMAVYGSRDLVNWFLVGTCKGNILVRHKGTPYRYFKVALITKLTSDEDLLKLTIEYEDKLTNKVR